MPAHFARALVVEDDPVFRRALVRTVRKWSDEVRVAGSVRHASRLLQPSLDLAIVDLRLADGDGKRVLRRAVAMSPRPLLLAISGMADPAEGFALAKMGVHSFMAKPFSPAALEQCIRDALLERDRSTRHGRVKQKAAPAPSPPLEDALHRMARRYGLSEHQRDLLRLAVSGVERRALAAGLGITENTCKTRVRRLLIRCNAQRLSDLVARVALNAAEDMDIEYDGHP